MFIISILMIIFLSIAECSIIDARTTCSNIQLSKPPMTKNVAQALTSVDFLKELVRYKDTSDETYRQEKLHHRRHSIDNHLTVASAVEYTGNLWFLKKAKVKFQEQMKISEISPDGKSFVVECVTKYKRNGASEWVDCARVSCQVSTSIDGNSFNMDVRSDLLVKNIPLMFGMGQAIRNKISSTFENAACSFLESYA